MKKFSLFALLLIMTILVGVGCTPQQANKIAGMSVDAILLDDAVDAQKDTINAALVHMTPEEANETIEAMDTLDEIQTSVKDLVTLEKPEYITPTKVLVLYLEAKDVTDTLKDNLYDEQNNFAVWSKIPTPKQIELEALYGQAKGLGKDIEEYVQDPENRNSIDIAKTVSTYGYLALKILAVSATL